MNIDFKSLLDSEEVKEMLSRRFNTDEETLLNYPVDTEDDDWFDEGLKFVIEEYNFFLFFDAIEFLRLNHVYFDFKTLMEIKKEFLENRPISQEIKDEVSDHIDAYIQSYVIDGEPKKMEYNTIEDISLDMDDLYEKCIGLIWENSKDDEDSTTKKTTDDYIEMLDKLEDDISDYIEMFNNSYDDISDLDIDIHHEDICHLKFLTMLKCKVDGGSFDMINQLDIRLLQEAEYAYTIPV